MDRTRTTDGVVYDLTALCPHSEQQKKITLTADDLQNVLRHTPGQKYHQLRGQPDIEIAGCVQEVLSDPDVIFGGVRVYEPGGRCYVGRPSYDYDADGTCVDPPGS